MHINVFEGARRVAKLFGVLWLVGVGSWTWFGDVPYVRQNYEIVNLNNYPLLASSDCRSDDREEFLSATTPAGHEVGISLCFRSQRADNNQMLVPFTMVDNIAYMDTAYSDEVSAYTNRIAAAFKLRHPAEAMADAEWSRQRVQSFKTGVYATLIGIAVLWMITAVIGWVVRGFLGIPQGADGRPLPVDTDDE